MTKLLYQTDSYLKEFDATVTVVDPEARTVGVGETMLEGALAALRRRGIRRFDAIVSPGHRLAKNFFESAGFSARRITMYHRDGEEA